MEGIFSPGSIRTPPGCVLFAFFKLHFFHCDDRKVLTACLSSLFITLTWTHLHLALAPSPPVRQLPKATSSLSAAFMTLFQGWSYHLSHSLLFPSPLSFFMSPTATPTAFSTGSSFYPNLLSAGNFLNPVLGWFFYSLCIGSPWISFTNPHASSVISLSSLLLSLRFTDGDYKYDTSLTNKRFFLICNSKWWRGLLVDQKVWRVSKDEMLMK